MRSAADKGLETGLTQARIISELVKAPHGQLIEYIPIGQGAAREDPDFLSHLIAWNEINGAVRDSKVALPVISLSIWGRRADTLSMGNAYMGMDLSVPIENSLAHLALLSPMDLMRAVRFARTIKTPGCYRAITRLVERYLRARAAVWPWWERAALQHRGTTKELYSFCHVKPGSLAKMVLFEGQYPASSAFAALKQLGTMSPTEAAGTILEKRLPFLVVQGALGVKVKDPAIVLALIERASPAELVSNMAMLEKLGVKTNPALRGALDKALGKVAGAKGMGAGRKATLKTTKAAGRVQDAGLKAKLDAVQERQIDQVQRQSRKEGKGPEGNWLVLADRSGSMERAIGAGREVAALLARMVTGRVHLVFFNTTPTYIEATGKTLAELEQLTRMMVANGGTSIGVGLKALMERPTLGGLDLDGIAIVSDAKENNPPPFPIVYRQYCEATGKTPAVYLYRMQTGMIGAGDVDLADGMRRYQFEMTEFDLRGGFDYTSLPNLVQTMRAGRYSLVEEVMETPLLTVEQALKARDRRAS